MTDEAAILSLFDDEVDEGTKINIVENLTKENMSTSGKRYIPSKDCWYDINNKYVICFLL